MHDLDRVQLEQHWPEMEEGLEDHDDGLGEYEADFDEFDSDVGEFEDPEDPEDPEGDFELGDEDAEEHPAEPTGDGESDDAMEMELAAELLAADSEEDLERTIHRAMTRRCRCPRHRRWRRRHRRWPVSRRRRSATLNVLRRIARRTLPAVGGAVGSVLLPGAGTVAGHAVGRAASRVLGLEMEGLSPEDQQFEVARRIVRLAGDASDHEESIPPQIPPKEAAAEAVRRAARSHAPGLLRQRRGGGMPGSRRAGRWIRRGRRIILLGV